VSIVRLDEGVGANVDSRVFPQNNGCHKRGSRMHLLPELRRRSFVISLLRFCCLSILSSVPVLAATPASMTLTVKGKQLTVTGASPGSAVIVTGVILTRRVYHSTLVRIQRIVEDEDRDGTITLAIDAEPRSRMIIVAADFRSGDYVVRNSDGGISPTWPFPLGAGTREVATLDLFAPTIELYLLRPAVGFWTLSARQGGAGDEDQANNGRIRVSVSSTKRLYGNPGNPPPPSTFTPHDVVIGFDTLNMKFFAGSVKP